jgi:hypothetical protein
MRDMKSIVDILQQKIKPKEKQTLLVEAIISGERVFIVVS